MPCTRALVVIAISLALSVPPANAAEEFFSAKLRGGNETPLSISTGASGVFAAQLDSGETTLGFALLYDLLEGGAPTAAHIHLGQPGITGGIVIHLCGTGGKPACPAIPAVVTGALTSSDVVTATGQGIVNGELSEVIRAMRKGDAYVNVHTTTFPTGEIRGPIQ